VAAKIHALQKRMRIFDKSEGRAPAQCERKLARIVDGRPIAPGRPELSANVDSMAALLAPNLQTLAPGMGAGKQLIQPLAG
jgi:hypothetical protein